jgi:hypothetical protein
LISQLTGRGLNKDQRDRRTRRLAVKLDRRRDDDDYAERMYRGIHTSRRAPAGERVHPEHLGPAKRS